MCVCTHTHTHIYRYTDIYTHKYSPLLALPLVPPVQLRVEDRLLPCASSKKMFRVNPINPIHTTPTRTHAHPHMHKHTHAHVYIYTYTHIYIYIYVSGSPDVYTYTYTSICMYQVNPIDIG